MEILRSNCFLSGGQNALFLRPFFVDQLEDIVGHMVERDGVHYVPLPHPSGASLWLNRPENQARVRKALQTLEQVKRELNL